MASRLVAPNSSFNNESGIFLVGTNIQADNVFIGSHVPPEERRLLQGLPFAAKAVFNHYDTSAPECLPNTRTDVLREIMTWARGQSGGRERVYWLNGMAGTGKSTIARTIARRCDDDGHLGASFFFSRGGGERETARHFVTSIAVQLAHRAPTLRRAICSAVRAHADIAGQLLSDQWKHLVLRPCAELAAASEALQLPLVVVVDALDECRDSREVEFVLQLVRETAAMAAASAPPQLLLFLTSRPEILIRRVLSQMSATQCRHMILHRIDPVVVDGDIRLFLEEHFSVIRSERVLPSGWPGDEIMSQLVQRAGGLFIWAATACRFVQNGGRVAARRLDTLLCPGSSVSATRPEQRLDEIYLSVLRSALSEDFSPDECEDVCNALKTVLGAIVLPFSSLSISSLASLLYMPGSDVLGTLCDLHSIIDVPDDLESPVRLHHASVRDFFLSDRRCTDARFWIDEKRAHGRLAGQCLRLMRDTLRKDMCGLRVLGAGARDVDHALLAERLPAHLRYACVYWIKHVQCSGTALGLDASVALFMEKHFLHWLEALSLIEKLADGVEMLALLERDGTPHLRALTSDAKRFVLYNRQMIEESPLQAYLSAVAFAPRRSLIRQMYLHQLPPWLDLLHGTRSSWGSELLSLEGHSEGVNGVAFSPDGKMLASASDDRTVRLWNAMTGARVGVLGGHFNCVNDVAFSPDGQLLASACDDMVIRVWNPETGVQRGVFEGHTGRVMAVVFSPAGDQLASASYDTTVRLWDVGAGVSCRTLVGHQSSVQAVAFSPDDLILASASDDKHVRLWSLVSRCTIHVLEGHLAGVLAVNFSPCGALLASASADTTVILWATDSGDMCRTLTGHWNSVLAVAFLPHGAYFASASLDKCVKLWHKWSRTPCDELEGHTEGVEAVAFSPDGRRLASASRDKTVKLWSTTTLISDSTTGDRPRDEVGVMNEWEKERHTSPAPAGPTELRESSNVRSDHSSDETLPLVTALVYSLDGETLAAAFRDSTIGIYHARTAKRCGVLRGHVAAVEALAFSPDGRLLASCANEPTPRLWNLAAGGSCTLLVGHTGYVKAVAFSPDGQSLATAAHDGTARLWDVRSGAAQSVLRGHSLGVGAVAFAPAGGLIATGSYDKTIKLWTVAPQTTLRATLRGRKDWISALAFSPDGKLLASAYYGRHLILWDAAAAEVLEAVDVAAPIRQLAFSADGSYLETNIGPIPISRHSFDSRQLPLTSADSLAVQNQWLTYGLRKLLWLPHENRSGRVAIHSKTVAMAPESGGLTVINLNFEVGSPWE